MKKIISFILLFAIMSTSMVTFADNKNITYGTGKIVDEFGNSIVVDNENIRIVKSPTKNGSIIIKYFKKTGKFEMLNEDRKLMKHHKSTNLESQQSLYNTRSYSGGDYQKTFYNYEYDAGNAMTPWDLMRPQSNTNFLDQYHFLSWEDSDSRQYLFEFADAVEILDDAEKDFILVVGFGAVDILREFALAAPGGQIAQISAVLIAAGKNGPDILDAGIVIGEAASECLDTYNYVLDNFRWR